MTANPDLETAMSSIHKMSVFIEHHFPGFDMSKESKNFYTNDEGDLVYIPQESGDTVPQKAAPAEDPASDPQPEPAPAPAPAEAPKAETPKPKPKSEAQKVLASGTQSGGDKPKLDPSKMGINQYLANADALVAQTRES